MCRCQLIVCIAQGHALEQGHYSEGLCGLHQETSERAAACQRAGKSSEEAGTCQPPPDAQDTGQFRLGVAQTSRLQCSAMTLKVD